MASALINILPASRGTIDIVDPAAGAGALLDAFQSEYRGPTQAFARDVDAEAMVKLAKVRPSWRVEVADALDADAHRGARTYDAVLLNPPFSYRGAQSVSRDGLTTSSPAIAFVQRALQMLKPRGALVALLPQSCLRSEKDAPAIARIREKFEIVQHDLIPRSAFYGVSARTVVVTFARSNSEGRPSVDVDPGRYRAGGGLSAYSFEVVRGSLPRHIARAARDEGGSDYVHSTELRGGVLLSSGLRVPRGARTIDEPALLLPRVGAPSLRKVVPFEGGRAVTMSDCVIAIVPSSAEGVAVLRSVFAQNWGELARRYGGSCAPYLTVDQLLNFLRSNGVSSSGVTVRQARGRGISRGPATTTTNMATAQ